MEQAFTQLVDGVLKYGAPGLIILGLILVIVTIWRLYQSSVETRVSEAIAAVKVIETNTSYLRAATAASEEQSRTREALTTAVTLLRERIEHEGASNRERLERVERLLERR